MSNFISLSLPYIYFSSHFCFLVVVVFLLLLFLFFCCCFFFVFVFFFRLFLFCQYCYWLLWSVFIYFFECSPRVLLLMCQYNPQCWLAPFLLLFLIYIVYVIFRMWRLVQSLQFFCLLVHLSKFLLGPSSRNCSDVSTFNEIFAAEFDLRCSFICSFISACLMVSASNIPKNLKFSFFPSVQIFSWFYSSIPSIVFFFPHFLL